MKKISSIAFLYLSSITMLASESQTSDTDTLALLQLCKETIKARKDHSKEKKFFNTFLAGRNGQLDYIWDPRSFDSPRRFEFCFEKNILTIELFEPKGRNNGIYLTTRIPWPTNNQAIKNALNECIDAAK